MKERVHETRVEKHPPITVRLRGRGGAAALHVDRVTLGCEGMKCSQLTDNLCTSISSGDAPARPKAASLPTDQLTRRPSHERACVSHYDPLRHRKYNIKPDLPFVRRGREVDPYQGMRGVAVEQSMCH
ncbi:hypothetical protein E2C01_059997 [Portunus trituberculatus]|uniref:Uncharacterized protein n=1 Tax=Portunus trituberculatus TaxID=210409 RepID=A0A5B7H117_PORTR|nr:hypothetical protein [Portunus trituberculatus]